MFFFPNKPIRIYDISKFLSNLDCSKWICQPKIDGKRLLISVSAEDKVSFFGRQGQAWTGEWNSLAKLPLPKPFFLDGELTRSGDISVWDAAVLGGKEVYKLPYRERWEIIRNLPIVSDNCRIFRPVQSVPCKDFKQIETVPNLEGYVFKNLDGTSFWGPYSTTTVSCQFKFRFK